MAAMPSQSLRIALDTNFVLNLAGGNELCLDCLDALRNSTKAKTELIVTATSLSELAFQATNGDTEEERLLAIEALHSLLKWGIKPQNLPPLGHGIVQQIADKIRTQQLLPFSERNDSFIIAEAALSGCDLLISSDSHIADIDQPQLNVLLNSQHANPLAIARPKTILKMLG